MSKIEFLQMVPALLFGISLAELALFLGKSTQRKGKLYWEHFILIAISFETIIFNWWNFFDRIHNMESSYFDYLIQLFPPLVSFICVANLLVENESPDAPLEEYFLKSKKRIFLSLALFLTVNVLTNIYFAQLIHLIFIPIIPIAFLMVNAFYDIKWLRTVGYIIKGIQVILFCIFFK